MTWFFLTFEIVFSGEEVGKLKLTEEMKEKLEGMAGGGAVSSENIDGGRKRSEVNLQINEQSASADDLAGPPAKKNSLIENKKLMMEQQLGATGRLFTVVFSFTTMQPV